MKPFNAISLAVAAGAVVAGCAMLASDSSKIDWSRVPTTTLTLFYPGQASFQWEIGRASCRERV